MSYKPEALLLGSEELFPPPALAGAAGLAGITALAFSNMANTWSLEDGCREKKRDSHREEKNKKQNKTKNSHITEPGARLI